MTGIDPVSSLNSVIILWKRGSLLLWALGSAALVSAIALVAYALLSADQSAQAWVPVAFVIAIVLLILAGFKTYQEKTIATMVFHLDDSSSFWHHAPQPDGREYTQIALRGRVTNVTAVPIYPTDVRLIHPRTNRVVQRLIFTEHEGGRGYGSDNAIAPGARSGFSVHFFAESFVGNPGKPMKLVIKVSDQLGHWHKVACTDLWRPEDRR
ncbi:MAG: hypothetical protein J0G99_05585 [Alphaproteobacteria bacterium]|nr:hypothetical protein [Alphaproteobacteria bacterium]